MLIILLIQLINMDTLPVELLHIIASHDRASYQALLSVPLFARSLTPGIIVDYKIAFGYNVRIKYEEENSCVCIIWTLDDKFH
jgi:hypothetical protein